MVKKKRSRLPAGVKRLADGRYKIRTTYSDPITGKRKDRMSILPHGASVAQAVAALEALKAQLVHPVAQTTAPGLTACCESWLRRKTKRNKRSTTLEAYAYALGHILELTPQPDLPVDQYTRCHLLTLRDALEAQAPEYSAETLKDRWSIWCRMLRDTTCDLGLHDPTYRMEGPAVATAPRREQETLSREEVQAVVCATMANTISSDYGVMVAILAYTGMRLGEGLALEWSAVDLEQQMIQVERSVAYTRAGGWKVTTPKAGKVRRVALAQPLLAILKTHREMLKRKSRLPVGLVCQASTGNYLQPTRVRSRLKEASKRAGLEIRVTPQVLRRSWNTLALSAEVDRVLVQAQIGHTTDKMSSHYLGVRDETLRASVERMWDLGVGVDAKSASLHEEGGR